MASFKDDIKTYISQNKFEAALKLVKQKAISGFTDLDTPVTLMSAEFEDLRKKVINGLVTQQDEKVVRQNLAHRLLMLIEDIDETEGVTFSNNGQNKDVILFIGANPFKNNALELDREVKEISEGLSKFGKRDLFDFRAKMHVSPTDLHRLLLESSYVPRFVHFAGNAVDNDPIHGTGVVFEDAQGNPVIVNGAILSAIFGRFQGIECVFLNTCHSAPSAMEIGKVIPFVIGVNGMIWDTCAIVFGVAFYEAIASGKDIPFAFTFAQDRILLEGFPPDQVAMPTLYIHGQEQPNNILPFQTNEQNLQNRIMR
jgi:Effector-associated domain 11